MSPSTRIALALAAGIALGFGLGRLTAVRPETSSGVTPVEPGGDRGSPSTASELSSAMRDTTREPSPESREVDVPSRRSSDGQELFSRALLEHHRAEFRAGWAGVRADAPDPGALAVGEQDFREQVLLLSSALGAAAATELATSEELADHLEAGDGLELLALALAGEWEPEFEDLTSKQSENWFAPRASGADVDGDAFARAEGKTLEAGMLLRFGAGIHVLDERDLRAPDRGTIPPDVTLVGAGKDVTLLRLGDISARGSVERLSFRDLTLDAQNDGLFDLRYEGASISMARVRVVRFDAAHGGCYIFDSRGGTLVRAVDTDFIGGYGRSPGEGRLLRNGPVIGRFTGCRFELIELDSAMRLGAGSALLFEGCSFEVKAPDPTRSTNDKLRFEGCSFIEIPRDTSQEELRKDLADLFYGA